MVILLGLAVCLLLLLVELRAFHRRLSADSPASSDVLVALARAEPPAALHGRVEQQLIPIEDEDGGLAMCPVEVWTDAEFQSALRRMHGAQASLANANIARLLGAGRES